MIHKIDKVVLAGAGTIKGNVNNQSLNGLIIAQTIKPTASDFLTVTLKSSKHEPKVLIPRINLLALSEMSDILFGFSNNLHADEQAEAGGTTLAGYFTAVYLGCLKNSVNDSSLEIILELAAAQTAGVYTYFTKDESDHLVCLTQSYTLTDVARDVIRLFAHTSATIAADFSTRDVNVLINADGSSANTDLMGLVGATNALSRIEALGELQTLLFYENADGLGSNVSYSISGAGSTTFSIIQMRDEVLSKRVSLGNLEATEKTISKIDKMSEERERALRRSGKIGSRSQYVNARLKMNVE